MAKRGQDGASGSGQFNFRVRDVEILGKFKDKCTLEGSSASEVLNEFIEAYARGGIKLPRKAAENRMDRLEEKLEAIIGELAEMRGK